MNKAILESYNIDYADGVARCMGDAELYKKMLKMFLDDNSFNRTKEAYKSKDYENMFLNAHELKGICGNLSLTNLYTSVVPLVEALRNKDISDIYRLFSQAENDYLSVCRGIELAIKD